MRGSCECNNIEVKWQIVDLSLVPRACQCDYCAMKSAAYVTKAGTRFEVTIHNRVLHKMVQHGSGSAIFHECGHCGQIIFITAQIDGELYGALNANYLDNKMGFPAPIEINFSDQSAEQKRDRWRQTWCHPVVIKTSGHTEYGPVNSDQMGKPA